MSVCLECLKNHYNEKNGTKYESVSDFLISLHKKKGDLKALSDYLGVNENVFYSYVDSFKKIKKLKIKLVLTDFVVIAILQWNWR